MVMVDVRTAVLLMFPAGEREDEVAVRSVSTVCVSGGGGEEEHTLTVASPELYTQRNIKEPLGARLHRFSLLPALEPDPTTALSAPLLCTSEILGPIKTRSTTTHVHLLYECVFTSCLQTLLFFIFWNLYFPM